MFCFIHLQSQLAQEIDRDLTKWAHSDWSTGKRCLEIPEDYYTFLGHLRYKRSSTITEKEAMGQEKGRERCVLVGLQMNANGRELLDWAISRVAEEGDRVVAVHVCRDSGTFLFS